MNSEAWGADAVPLRQLVVGPVLRRPEGAPGASNRAPRRPLYGSIGPQTSATMRAKRGAAGRFRAGDAQESTSWSGPWSRALEAMTHADPDQGVRVDLGSRCRRRQPRAASITSASTSIPSPRALSRLAAYKAMAANLPKRPKVAVTVEPDAEALPGAAPMSFDPFQVHFRPRPAPQADRGMDPRRRGQDPSGWPPSCRPKAEIPDAWLALSRGFLLDTFDRSLFGGTGRTGDWAKFRPPAPAPARQDVDPGRGPQPRERRRGPGEDGREVRGREQRRRVRPRGKGPRPPEGLRRRRPPGRRPVGRPAQAASNSRSRRLRSGPKA